MNAAFFDVPQYALQTANTPNVANKYLLLFNPKPYWRAATLTTEKVFLHSDGISPWLTLMSPSNFYKTHTFLRVTSACHCLVMMTYTNIQRIALLFHDFFHTKLIPKPPGLLLCSLHHHYIRPPASGAPLTRKLPTMCLVPRRPPERRHSSGCCWLSSPLLRYIYIYISPSLIYSVTINVSQCVSHESAGFTPGAPI